MRRYGLPVVPAIIAIILGPVAEEQLRRALQISDGELSGLINTPFSKVVYAIVVLLLVVPVVIDRIRSRRGGGGDRGDGTHHVPHLAPSTPTRKGS